MDETIEKYQYPLSGKPRGIGLIIVNYFNEHQIIRKGAEVERKNLTELFTLMGLEVREYFELTSDAIRQVLCTLAKESRLKTDSMLAVAISSHGCEDGLLGVNVDKKLENPKFTDADDCVSPNQIRTILNGSNCPLLAKKPKLLILNGCRGDVKEEIIEGDNVSHKAIVSEQKATIWSDFFTIHSCELGTISFRSHKEGSLFINAFLNTYKDYGRSLPIELMMPLVNRKLIQTSYSKDVKVELNQVRGTQSCTWESSCTCVLKITPVNAEIQKVPVATQPAVVSFRLVWATCSKGVQGPNQMSTPSGLITTPDGQIYITDSASKCIWIYSTDGEPLYQDISPKTYKQLVIGNLGLTYCWGLCIRDNFLFVSCTLALIKFSLFGGGLLTHKFHDAPITGMDIGEDGVIYACERHSCKLLLLDMDLNILSKLDLTHTLNPANDRLMDVKVVDEHLYLLINKNAYIIQVFDTKGKHVRNLVSSLDLTESLYFAINRTKKTIFAGDIVTNELKGFSADGKLMYSTGEHGDKRGNFAEPNGIDLTADGEVVVVSPNKNKFMLQSFKIPPNM